MNLPRNESDSCDDCDDCDDFDSDELDMSLAARYEPLRDAYFNPLCDENPPNGGLGPNAGSVADSKQQPKQRHRLANHLCTSKARAQSRSQSHRSNPNVASAWNHDVRGRGGGRGRGRRTESMRHMDSKTRSNSTQAPLVRNTRRGDVATNHHHANHEDSYINTAPRTPLVSTLAVMPTSGVPTPLSSPLPSPTTTATSIGDNQECQGLLDLGAAITSALGTDDDRYDDHDDHDYDDYGRTITTNIVTNDADVTMNTNIHPTDNAAIRSPPATTPAATTRTRKEWRDLVDMNQVSPEMRRRLLRRNGRTRNTYCLQSIFSTKSSLPRDRHCQDDECIMPSWWDLPDGTSHESSMQSQASTTTTTTTLTKPAFPTSYVVKQQRQEQSDQHRQHGQHNSDLQPHDQQNDDAQPHDQQNDDAQPHDQRQQLDQQNDDPQPLDDLQPHDQQQHQEQHNLQQQQQQQPPVAKPNGTHVYRVQVSARQLDRNAQQQSEKHPPVPKPGETLVYRIRVTACKLNPDEVVSWADSPTFQKRKLSMGEGVGKRQTNVASNAMKSEENRFPPRSLYRQAGPSIALRDDQHYSRRNNSNYKSPIHGEESESMPRRCGATRRQTHVPPSA